MVKRLTDDEARSRMEARGFRPDIDVPYPTATKPWPGVWVACGHRGTPSLHGVWNGGAGCARLDCATRKQVERQTLSESEARFRVEANGFRPDPDRRYPGSQGQWPGVWLECGHRGVAIPANIWRRRHGCGHPDCVGSAISTKRRLSDAEARERMRAKGFRPDANEPYPGAAHRWSGVWVACGHRARASLGPEKCGRCAGKIKLTDGEARARVEAKGFRPDADAPYPTMNGRWPGVWVACGHRSNAKPASVVDGHGCQTCQMAKIAGANRLTDAEARERMEAHGFIPDADAPYAMSNTKWSGVWQDCGHRGRPSLNKVSNGQGCGRCPQPSRLMSDADARARMLLRGFVPDETVPYAGGDVKWPGVWDACGHRAAVWPYSVYHAHTQCPCSVVGGYDKTRQGWMYLMARHGEQQVGISNKPSRRLATHRSDGWELLDLVGPVDGADNFENESAIKRWLRDKVGTLPRTTEAWSTAALEVSSIRELFATAGLAMIQSTGRNRPSD